MMTTTTSYCSPSLFHNRICASGLLVDSDQANHFIHIVLHTWKEYKISSAYISFIYITL